MSNKTTIKNEPDTLEDLILNIQDKNSKNLSMSTCPNPFCPCTILTLKKKANKKNDISISFKFDVEKKKIIKDDTELKAINEIISLFEKHLDDEHWNKLTQMHRNLKYIHTVKFNENDPQSSLPYFNIEEIKEGLLVGYYEIFLWDEEISFDIDNVSYTIDDQYCLQPTCKCKDTLLHFFGYQNGQTIFDDTETPVIRYNYKTKKWERENYIRNLPHSESELVKKLKQSHPDITNIFSSRHIKLKSLYKKYLKKENSELLNKKNAQSNVKIGRNQACPCGSGKKYKKCCGMLKSNRK